MEITFIISFGILISAVIHIHAEYQHNLNRIFIFKPATTSLIIILGLLVLPEELGWYHYAILIGLLFSLGGDIALMLPSDKFLIGLVSFLVGHLFYISGLISGIDWNLTLKIWIPLVGLGMMVFLSLRPNLGSMQIPVLCYVLVIMTMSATAWERDLVLDLPQSTYAAFGASLFMVSDSLLAWNRFRTPFKAAQLLVLSTYFMAQWLIALSLSQAVSIPAN